MMAAFPTVHGFVRMMAGTSSAGLPALSSKSTAQEVVDRFVPKGGEGLKGQAAVVTGGNSGIGLETCRALAGAGAKVVLCSRSLEAGEEAAQPLRELGGDVEVQKLDLASLESVEAAAAGLREKLAGHTLDYLVLNAGIMAVPTRELTVDGFEKQVGTNHFGHAHLTNEMMDRVEADATRVVVLSSTAHNFGDIDTANLHYTDSRRYTPWGAYGQSKACNLLYAKSLAEKLRERGSKATAFSVHPGVIRTNLWREPQGGVSFLGLDKLLANALPRLIADKSIPQGAATTLFACLAPRLETSYAGAYFADCDVATPNRAITTDRPELRERLWDATMEQLAAAVATRKGGPSGAWSGGAPSEQQEQQEQHEAPGAITTEKTEKAAVPVTVP